MHKPLENVTFLKIFVTAGNYLNNIDLLNTYLPRLQHTYLESVWSKLEDSEEMHFKNVEYFTIEPITMDKYPFSFEKLKHFTVIGSIVLNDEWCELVCNIPQLTTLKIMGIIDVYPDPLCRMLRSPNLLSNIEELFLEVHDDLLPHEIIRYLDQSKRLKRLALLMRYRYVDYAINDRKTILRKITSNFEWCMEILCHE